MQKKRVLKTKQISQINNIGKKMHSNNRYAEKIATNYAFAKKEFEKANIGLDKRYHQQFKKAFYLLNKASRKMFESHAEMKKNEMGKSIDETVVTAVFKNKPSRKTSIRRKR